MPKAVLIWKYTAPSKPIALAVSENADKIAICFPNSEIHMLDENGKVSWKSDSQSTGIINAIDIAHASQENMTLVGTKNKTLHLLDSTGVDIWTRNLPTSVISVSISSRANLSVVGTEDGVMHAFDRTGKLLWHHQVGGTSFPVNTVSVSSNGSYIISGSKYRYSYFYDSKGNVLWDKDLGGAIVGTSINRNGDYLGLAPQDSQNEYAEYEKGILLEELSIVELKVANILKDYINGESGSSGKIDVFANDWYNGFSNIVFHGYNTEDELLKPRLEIYYSK